MPKMRAPRVAGWLDAFIKNHTDDDARERSCQYALHATEELVRHDTATFPRKDAAITPLLCNRRDVASIWESAN